MRVSSKRPPSSSTRDRSTCSSRSSTGFTYTVFPVLDSFGSPAIGSMYSEGRLWPLPSSTGSGGGGKRSIGSGNSRKTGGGLYDESASTVTIMTLPRHSSRSKPFLEEESAAPFAGTCRSRPVYRSNGPHFRYKGGLKEAVGGAARMRIARMLLISSLLMYGLQI